MRLFKSLCSFIAVASVAKAAPSSPAEGSVLETRQQSYYSKKWTNDKAVVEYVSLAGGAFSVNWDEPNGGNFVVGKGYNPGKEIKFNYSGTFVPGENSNTYLALYGWVYNPTAEFYVIESFGVHHPADNGNSTCYGHFDSDGGTYEVWMKWQINTDGTPLFRQYWAVRTKRRVGGTITTSNFFKAWRKVGLPINSLGEMVIGVEGQWGSGSATLTAGSLPTTTVKESSTPTTRTNVPIRTGTCTAVIDI